MRPARIVDRLPFSSWVEKPCARFLASSRSDLANCGTSAIVSLRLFPQTLTVQVAAFGIRTRVGCFVCCRKASPCKLRQCRKCVVASVPPVDPMAPHKLRQCRNALLRRFPQRFSSRRKNAVVSAPCGCTLVCRSSLGESAPSFTAQTLPTPRCVVAAIPAKPASAKQSSTLPVIVA